MSGCHRSCGAATPAQGKPSSLTSHRLMANASRMFIPARDPVNLKAYWKTKDKLQMLKDISFIKINFQEPCVPYIGRA